MESRRAVGKFHRSGTFACEAEIAHIFHSLHAVWHLPYLGRRAVAKPKAIARLLVDKFLCSIPWVKILP